MLLPVILIGLIVTLYFIYQIGSYNENYWMKRGVKFYPKNRLIGPFWDFFMQKGPMFQIFGELYEEYKNEPVVGIGALSKPTLFIIDLKNVQQVLQGDFQSFNHRGMESIEGDQLSDNILFMNGPRWKLMRQNMSPLFTATKLRNMYYIMDKSAQNFVEYLKTNPKSWEGHCFDTLTTFCNAAVCGAIFGIGTESIFSSPFLKMARTLSPSNFKNSLKFAMVNLSPRITNSLGIKLFKEFEDFFVGAITEVMKKREQENIKRHDFADICISLQKKGTMRDQTTGCELEPTYGLLSAQALFFFVAGVEPCANAMFSTLIELCRHPDILQRVHEEIDENFEKHNSIITYEVISDMNYLDKVLSEAMRMYPPIGYLSRQCVKDTVLPVGNIKVEKGTKVYTPIYQIHHDPKLYPEPSVFDPERFSKDRKPSDDIYMPFGLGNRTCIGARYAKLQVLAGLVHVLRHFTVKAKQEIDKITFKSDILNVRVGNFDVQFLPRNIE